MATRCGDTVAWLLRGKAELVSAGNRGDKDRQCVTINDVTATVGDVLPQCQLRYIVSVDYGWHKAAVDSH